MYYYDAHATALGGRLTHPDPQQIESQASASLPITGGIATAHIDRYRLDGPEGPIAFKAAQCKVTGEPAAGNSYLHATHVSVEIEQLNVLNKVTADRIVLELDCKHDCTPQNKQEEPSITTAGSDFVNLRINGHPLTIDTEHVTLAGTYGKYATALTDSAGKQNLLDLMVGREMPEQKQDQDPQHRVDIYKGYKGVASPSAKLGKTVVCSFVKKIRGLDGTGIDVWGPVIRIPNFGTVYLGELVISHGMRRLTMLRFELGSPQGGSVGVGTGTGNGTDYP